jgi:hypothetical protein
MSQLDFPPTKDAPGAVSTQSPSATSAEAAIAPLEPNPVWQLLQDAVSPIRKYFHTRRLVRAQVPLHDYTPERLTGAGAMGPWTYNITESILASLPAALLAKAAAFFWPLPKRAEVEEIQTIWQRAAELEPTISAAVQPFIFPFVLTLIAGLCARGSLHPRDATPSRLLRAKYVYLYHDGTYGLLPQMVLGLALVLVGWITIHGAWTAPAAIVLGIATGCALVHAMYVSVYLQPRALFAVNGYSTKRVYFWTRRSKYPENVAPWSRYTRTVFGGGFALSLALGLALWLMTFSLALGLVAIGPRMP